MSFLDYSEIIVDNSEASNIVWIRISHSAYKNTELGMSVVDMRMLT